MEEAQDILIGLQHSGFAIGDGVFLTEGFDERARLSQFVSGHGWEEVMLDLIVEAVIPEVNQGGTVDVAGCEYLLAQEVGWAVRVHNGHCAYRSSSSNSNQP